MTSKPAHPCNFSRCCKILQWYNSQAGIYKTQRQQITELCISLAILGLGGINILAWFFDHTQYY